MAGVYLVLVPTLFTLFPHWSEKPVGAKLLVLLIWLGAAIIVVVAGVRQGEQIAGLAERERHGRRHLGSAATRQLIRAALLPGASGLPPEFEVQVFLPTPDGQRIVPEFDPTGAGPEEGWDVHRDPPQAVSGSAWKRNSLIIARVPELFDEAWELTPEQQGRYQHLTGVASTPIQNARGRAIGVLTVFTDTDEPDMDVRFATLLLAAAEVVARVLIDVAHIASD